MIGLLAATGAPARRLDERVAAGALEGHRWHELTPPGAGIRVAAVSPDGSERAAGTGSVLSVATEGSVCVAAFGSGIRRLPHGADGLLRRFRSEGRRFLDGAPQDVAAVLADQDGGILIAASTSGHHGWYAAEDGDDVLVSTAMGLLARIRGPELAVDRSYEDFLLGFGFLPDDRTVYSGVKVLPSGRTRRWPGGAEGSVSVSTTQVPDPPDTAAEVRRRLYDTFCEALEEQAGGRRRHAVLLGGFDSALVVAGLRRLGHEVHTYTFSFGDPRYEQRHAEAIASRLGAHHHWVELAPSVIGQGLTGFADIFGHPAPQPHYQLHTVHASRVIAEEGHDHIFTGDGCDSVFLGYPTVSVRSRLLERAARIPRPVRRGALALASLRSTERVLGHVARIARSTLRRLELPWPARGHLPTRYLDRVSIERLRRGESPPQAETVREIRLRLAEGLEHLDPVRLAFHGNGLIGQSGSKVEGSVAMSGIPQMSPYRDSRLKSFVGQLPVELLRPRRSRAGSEGKAVLYAMVRERELLPDFVIDMPKQSPSDSPIDRWYAGPLRPVVRELLDGLPFPYDEAYVDEILSPKWAEEFFRNRISLGHHAFQAIGILCSYAAFTSRAS